MIRVIVILLGMASTIGGVLAVSTLLVSDDNSALKKKLLVGFVVCLIGAWAACILFRRYCA
jgi:uncharacterized membrane protein HdeD (DUF308 family)